MVILVVFNSFNVVKNLKKPDPVCAKCPHLTLLRFNNNKKSSVKDHCLLSGHVCLFDDFAVLNYESHKFKRLIKESLLVTKDKPLLKKQVKLLKLERS